MFGFPNMSLFSFSKVFENLHSLVTVASMLLGMFTQGKFYTVLKDLLPRKGLWPPVSLKFILSMPMAASLYILTWKFHETCIPFCVESVLILK